MALLLPIEFRGFRRVARCVICRWLLAIGAALPFAAVAGESSNSQDMEVAVHRDGVAIVIDVNLLIDASPQEAWDVLTDYDHMAEFVSSLTTSRIVARRDGTLEVAQTIHFGIGPFGFDFDNLREVELTAPREIRSTLVRGAMKESRFTTRLVPRGGATRIIYHGRFIPDRWIPPVIGIAVLRTETRKQFDELRAEILRRVHRAAPNPAQTSGPTTGESRRQIWR